MEFLLIAIGANLMVLGAACLCTQARKIFRS
jgi:hypothetical protein